MKPNKQEPAPSNYPGSEQDSGWNFTDVSVEAGSPDKPSLRSKIGKLATSIADWIKNESTSEPDRLPDNQDKVEVVSLSRLMETALTPEQRKEVESIAFRLSDAIGLQKQSPAESHPSSNESLSSAIGLQEQSSAESLAKKLTIMEQPARDLAIKRVLDGMVDFGLPSLLTATTQFLTDRHLLLENYDGLAETTISFLNNFSQSTMDVDESPYTYFVNGVLNDEKVSRQIKTELASKKFVLTSTATSISKNIIIDRFKSYPRDTKNLAAFVKSLENVGIDIATNDFFIQSCIENSVIDDSHPGTIPLQENLYQAGLINDDNIGRLYDRLIRDRSEYSSARNMHGLSLSLCPDSEVTRYWRQFRRTSRVGITSPSDRGITTESDTRSFRCLLDCVDQVHDNSDFGKYFRNGIPGQQYYNRLQGSPLLTKDNEVRKFVSCLGDMPLTPEIYSILGQSQVKALDMYKEWNEKGAPNTFLGLADQYYFTDIDSLISLSRKADSFLNEYPLADLADRSRIINAYAQGKDAILGKEYFADLVLYNCDADYVFGAAIDNERLEKIHQHLDTLSRFNLFDGDRARMVNYAVLADRFGRAGQLFDELAGVDELDETARDSLNIVLRTCNRYDIRTVEELENYRAVIAERATSDLVSDDVRDACGAISFIMLPDLDGYDLSCFDLNALGRRHIFSPDDVATINLYRRISPTNFGLEYDGRLDKYFPADESKKEEIYNGKATEKLLQIIAGSPLCVPVEDESGVVKITKVEGAVSDLIKKLHHYITDDWNKSLIDLDATGEGIEHLAIEEDSPDGAVEVVKLTSAPFKMLSHTIYGRYLHPDIFRALINDPGIWNTAQGSATISTSCIDEKHYSNYLRAGSDEASRVLLGFNHIQPGGIVAMAPNDGYLRGSLKLEMGGVLFTTCDELMRKFDRVKHLHDRFYRYNEVGLSRMSSEPEARNGRLQPSHIIVHGSSIDDINENSKKFARYFGVPITLIDDEAYRKKYNVEPD